MVLGSVSAGNHGFLYRGIIERLPKEKAGAWLDLHTPAESLLPEAVQEVVFQPAEAKESKPADHLNPHAKGLAVP